MLSWTETLKIIRVEKFNTAAQSAPSANDSVDAAFNDLHGNG